MEYEKTNWQNSPSTNTPLNADNLNHIENGIYDAFGYINDLKNINNADSGNEIVELTKNSMIITNQDTGETVNLTPVSSPNGLCCAVVNCSPGDKFIFYGSSGTNGRLYAFVDSSDKMLIKAIANVVVSGLVVSAPTNASKCVVNIRGFVIKGETVDSRIKKNSFTRQIFNAFLLNKIERYNGGLGNINSDTSVDKSKIYIATLNTANNNRLMIYHNTEWIYYENFKISDFLPYTNFEKSDTLYRLLRDGYTDYNGGLGTINSDTSADKTKIYKATTGTENNNRLMVFTGLQWEYLDTVKSTTMFPSIQESINNNTTNINDVLCLHRIIGGGWERYNGGVAAISIDDTVDKNKVYVATTNTENNDRLMVCINNVWQFFKNYKISDLEEIEKYETYVFYKRLFFNGCERYQGGIGIINLDDSVDKQKLYIATVNTENFNRIMIYNGVTWEYYHDYKLEDISYLVNNNIIQQESISEIGIPLLDEARAKIVNYNKTQKCFNFMFITDTHVMGDNGVDLIRLSDNNLDLFVKMANEKWANCAIHGGDVYTSYELDNKDAAKTIDDALSVLNKIQIPFYVAKGNHDTNGKHKTAVSQEEQANPDWEHTRYFVKSELGTYGYLEVTESTWDGTSQLYKLDNDERITKTQWSLLTQTNVERAVYDEDNRFGGYYYVDFEDENIRLIVLNPYDTENLEDVSYSRTQTKWICEVALDTDKGIIIALHTAEPVSLLKAFINGTVYTRASVSYSFDFSVYSTRNLIAVIHGHTHADNYTNENGYNYIGCDSGYCEPNRLNTINEYSFTVFTVDTTDNLIYATKVGRGSDREFSYGINPSQIINNV